MKFSRIYKETSLFWPSQIQINDGELKNNNGGYFPSLCIIWDKAEDSATRWSEFHQLMVWAIYSALHKMAIEALKNDENFIYKKAINFKLVEKIFSDNLNENYPRHMKRAYKNDLRS